MLCKIVSHSASHVEEVFFSLRVNADFSWSLLLLGESITSAISPYLLQFPMSVADIEGIVNRLDSSRICIGNRDDKFSVLVQKNEGKFKNASGT